MKKIIISTLCLLGLLTAFNVFAQGKVTPFDWSEPKDVDKILNEERQIDEATTTLADVNDPSSYISDIYVLGFAPEICQPNGSCKKIKSIDDLKLGGEIRTGDGSAMVITFKDGSEVFVGSLSVIDFEIRLFNEALNKAEEIYDRVERELKLIKGKIKSSIVKRAGQKFQVRTPQAVCAVRGTEFVVVSDNIQMITSVYLKEGMVDIDNLHGKKITLNEGEKATIDSVGQIKTDKLNLTEWEQASKNLGEQTAPVSRTSSRTLYVKILVGLCPLIVIYGLYKKQITKKP